MVLELIVSGSQSSYFLRENIASLLLVIVFGKFGDLLLWQVWRPATFRALAHLVAYCVWCVAAS